MSPGGGRITGRFPSLGLLYLAMRVPFLWLEKYFCSSLPPIREVSDRLTAVGTESEVVAEDVLELDILPNRGDLLSMHGVAREVSAALDISLHDPLPMGYAVTDIAAASGDAPAIDVREAHRCRRYAGCYIEGVRVGPSPEWLCQALRDMDITPIHNIVDASNYVMVTMGQPTHAFDARAIGDEGVVVRLSRPGETLTLLNGDIGTCKSDEHTMIAASDGRPLAVAGVMGGMDSRIQGETTSVILESAWFEPGCIRRSARALGVRTESSYRFERWVNPDTVVTGLTALTNLIVTIAGGRHGPIQDHYPTPFQRHTISLPYHFIAQKLGYTIPLARVVDILTRLNISLSNRPEHEDDTLELVLDRYKMDIRAPIDVVEEIARIHGYDHIPSVLPTFSVHPTLLREPGNPLSRIREKALALGIQETVTDTFMDDRILAQTRLDSYVGEPIKLRHPLSQEQRVVRNTLIPNMLAVLEHNRNHGQRTQHIYECGF